MAKAELTMNANPVVAYLQKPAESFTKNDIIRFVKTRNEDTDCLHNEI